MSFEEALQLAATASIKQNKPKKKESPNKIKEVLNYCTTVVNQ